MTKIEIQENIINLKEEMKGIISNGETEKRELNETETSRMAEIRNQIDSLENDIQKIEEEERKLQEENNKNKKQERKMENTFNLGKLVKGIVNNNVSEEDRQFVNGNSINVRAAIQATVATQGQEIVPEQKASLDVAIRNASVLGRMGAKWYRDAVGNISIPKYSGSSTAWADSENAQASDGAGEFSEVILEPKRLTSYIVISRQALEQSNDDLEAILIADLAKAIGEKFDKTIFGAESGTTARPAGLFNDSAYTTTGTSLAAATFDDVLALEDAVEEKNGTDYIFVCDNKVKHTLRGVQTASGLEFVFNNGEIDGRKTIVSNSVNAKSLMAIVPEDLAVATWDYNLIVDSYTLADKNQIKVVVNYLCDAKLRGDRIAAEIFS